MRKQSDWNLGLPSAGCFDAFQIVACTSKLQKLTRSASRNWRSPPSTLFARLKALVILRKPAEDTFALGLLKCGVFERL